MGKHGVIAQHPHWKGEILALVADGKRAKDIGEKYDISTRMVNYYLKKWGVGYGKGSGTFTPDHGQFAKWLEEHKGEELPVKTKDIAKLSGINSNVIKCYFQRRRERAYETVKQFFLSERKRNTALKDRKGRTIPLKAVRKWGVSFEKGYSKPHLTLHLYGGGLAFSTFDEEHIISGEIEGEEDET